MESYELKGKMTDNMHLLNTADKQSVMVDAATYLDDVEIVQAFKEGLEPEDYKTLREAFIKDE